VLTRDTHTGTYIELCTHMRTQHNSESTPTRVTPLGECHDNLNIYIHTHTTDTNTTRIQAHILSYARICTHTHTTANQLQPLSLPWANAMTIYIYIYIYTHTHKHSLSLTDTQTTRLQEHILTYAHTHNSKPTPTPSTPATPLGKRHGNPLPRTSSTHTSSGIRCSSKPPKPCLEPWYEWSNSRASVPWGELERS
jgi:hypothetical protein